MKRLTILLAVLLVACSRDYQPSDAVRRLSATLTDEAAVATLQDVMWSGELSPGVCGSRGFWYDEKSNLVVHKDHVSLIAFKRGKEITTKPAKFENVVVYEKLSYDFVFDFSHLTSIRIYNEPRQLTYFPNCHKQYLPGRYRVIDLYADELHNMKFVVLNEDFDRTMAALLYLMPGIPVVDK